VHKCLLLTTACFLVGIVLTAVGEGWKTHKGVANAAGPDSWTRENTCIEAEVKYDKGDAVQLTIHNYGSHSVWISGTQLGHNEQHPNSGHTGVEVPGIQSQTFDLGHSVSGDQHVANVEFTYEYIDSGACF
jgi:hypothetical protein